MSSRSLSRSAVPSQPTGAVQVLTRDGELLEAPPISFQQTRKLYRTMTLGRAFDRHAVVLQTQGLLTSYAPAEGQEAAQVGSAAALRHHDWMVPSYREPIAMWMHGYPLDRLLAARAGSELGGSPPTGVNVLPLSLSIGSQLTHAVGLAWAERLQGRRRIALTYFGDGATSEGDFHEAMNFAARFSIGCIFLCQNNGWAISTPRSRQTASETIAQKAIAYGMPGYQVDGNDLFAVYKTTLRAIRRARMGKGPTLIEALTYRLGPHTTSDDAARYRTDKEVESWRQSDPLTRVRLYLSRNDAWSPEWQVDIDRRIAHQIEMAVDSLNHVHGLTPEECFDAMYAELPTHLVAQRASALEFVQ